jgi:hypothetical protein
MLMLLPLLLLLLPPLLPPTARRNLHDDACYSLQHALEWQAAIHAAFKLCPSQQQHCSTAHGSNFLACTKFNGIIALSFLVAVTSRSFGTGNMVLALLAGMAYTACTGKSLSACMHARLTACMLDSMLHTICGRPADHSEHLLHTHAILTESLLITINTLLLSCNRLHTASVLCHTACQLPAAPATAHGNWCA